ncbi:MAG TPA: MDR family MFS transporter [Acidimicrobiales bacterium]
MTATLDAPVVNANGYTKRQILFIMSGLMLGLLLASLDQTIVSTALPTISRDFHRLDLYSWVVTAYLLTSTASTPLYGKIGDQFGRKRIFQIAIVIFLIGSALSGLAQNMYQLIIFRGVQGVGAGGLITLTLAIIGDVIPPVDRGRYQGYFGAVFGVSSVIGPLIGGFLVDQASWRWVFYVNLPVGAVALIVINRVLQLDHVSRRSRVDVLGALLIVTGVSFLLVGVQNAGSAAKVTASSVLFGIVGIALIGVFVWWERRAAEPIVDLGLFRIKVFTVSNVLGFITGMVMFGALLFLPLYFQTVRKISPTFSGLRLLPMLAGMLSMSILGGRLVSRTGRYRWSVIAGTAILAVGIGMMSLIRVDTAEWIIALMLLIIGTGLGLFMQVLVLVVQNAVPRENLGAGTAAVTFFRTLGGAIGAAVLGAVLVLQEKTHGAHYVHVYGRVEGPLQSFTHAMDTAFRYAFPVAVIAFLLSFLLQEVKLRGSSAFTKTPAVESLG